MCMLALAEFIYSLLTCRHDNTMLVTLGSLHHNILKFTSLGLLTLLDRMFKNVDKTQTKAPSLVRHRIFFAV